MFFKGRLGIVSFGIWQYLEIFCLSQLGGCCYWESGAMESKKLLKSYNIYSSLSLSQRTILPKMSKVPKLKISGVIPAPNFKKQVPSKIKFQAESEVIKVKILHEQTPITSRMNK